MIGRILRTFNAFIQRVKIGSLEGGLKFNIKNSGTDSPRAKMFMSQITATAWKIHILSNFFQRLGFSFADYTAMYNAAVHATPDIFVNNKKLIATYILVDDYEHFEPSFRAYSQAVHGQEGNERSQGLALLMNKMVNDIAHHIQNQMVKDER